MTPRVKGLLLGSGQTDEDSNEVPRDTASWVGLSAQDMVGRPILSGNSLDSRNLLHTFVSRVPLLLASAPVSLLWSVLMG